MSNTSDIKIIIASWGNWARQQDGLGFKSPSKMLINSAPEVDSSDYGAGSRYDKDLFISDEKAMIVDRIIGTLLKAHNIEGECLVLRYVYGKYPKQIAQGYLTEIKYGKNSQRTVSEYVAVKNIAFGEGFCSGYIANL
ncbi:MAG: antiterminator Q family protein [Psychrobacter sp.]